jgi:hypothetical protein
MVLDTRFLKFPPVEYVALPVVVAVVEVVEVVEVVVAVVVIRVVVDVTGHKIFEVPTC